MEALFVTSLFLPVLWRYAMAVVGNSTLSNARDVATFVLPLSVIAVMFLWVAWGTGPYGFFIPLMLVVFWLPQLVGIGLFIYCDGEARN